MGVSEEEGSRLGKYKFVKLLKIKSEISFLVITDKVNTPGLVAGQVGSKLGDGLLSRTTKSD